MSKTGATILLTATTELIVEISSVELFGPNVLRFFIFSVPVPTSTFSKSSSASVMLNFTYSIISALFATPIGLYPLEIVEDTANKIHPIDLTSRTMEIKKQIF